MRPFIQTLQVLTICHTIYVWLNAIIKGWQAKKQSFEKSASYTLEQLPVSIIIPAWCESSTIQRCLQSLENIEYADWEVIVVAGGPDNTYNYVADWIAQNYVLHLLHQKPDGKNAALQQGLSIASGEIIVILDADSIVEPDWLLALVQPILTGSTDAVCGQYIPLRDSWITQLEQIEQSYAGPIMGSNGLQGSGSIALRRDVLTTIGAFPLDVRVGVDWDLGIRLLQQGYRCSYTADAKVYSERPATLLEFWDNEVRWRRAHLQSLWRHRGFFFKTGSQALQSLSFYIVTGMSSIAAVICIARGLGNRHKFLDKIGPLASLFLGWVAIRRPAFIATVAIYSNKMQLFKIIWAPIVLLGVSFLATLRVFATLFSKQIHFQGPRPSYQSSILDSQKSSLHL